MSSKSGNMQYIILIHNKLVPAQDPCPPILSSRGKRRIRGAQHKNQKGEMGKGETKILPEV